MHKLTRRLVAAGAAMVLAALGTTAVAQAHTVGEPGDPTMLVHLNDSEAGGSYHQDVRAGLCRRRPPTGRLSTSMFPRVASAAPRASTSLDPAFDHNPDDDFTPCADNSAADYLITQAQIDALGDELANHIVAVDEAHFGDIGTGGPATTPSSDALVMLVYNVQDETYYDCSVDTYTAGYFAPEYIDEAGMNVIVVDAFDWANRIGDRRREPARPVRGRHRPRARAPADELLRPRRGVVGRRGPRRHGGLPQRLRHRRLAPDLPPGLPPRDVTDPVGRRSGELRGLAHLLPVPVGAGRRQR